MVVLTVSTYLPIIRESNGRCNLYNYQFGLRYTIFLHDTTPNLNVAFEAVVPSRDTQLRVR